MNAFANCSTLRQALWIASLVSIAAICGEAQEPVWPKIETPDWALTQARKWYPKLN